MRVNDAEGLLGGGMLSKALKLGWNVEPAREKRADPLAEAVLGYARET
jgi:hypothetical protein